MFITGTQILLYVGVKSPNEVETAWAEYVADAINEGIVVRLNGAEITNPPPAELITAAIMAAAEAYKRREAPFGGTAFAADDQTAIRLARDYLHAVAPMIDRYGNGPGIG